MGVFNLLETFFFISLAITFVLIMMLVYHFKGRILIIEQKCDTMFEIMNNMVKEMKNIKYNASGTSSYPPQFMFQSNPESKYTTESKFTTDSNFTTESKFTTESLYNPEMILPNNESIYFIHNNSTLEKVDDDDSDNSDGYSIVEDDEPEFAKIIVSDNEDDISMPIKIINVDINGHENIEIISDTISSADKDENEDEIEDEIKDENEDENGDENEDETGDETFTVNKVDITVLPEELDSEYLEKSDSIDYKKMDVSYLRTMVITRGLVSDTKKLKKPDLIRILEEAEMNIQN